MSIGITNGWEQKHQVRIAELYDEAFGAKLSSALPDKSSRIDILANSFKPNYSFVAFDGETPIGIAGFSDKSGALTGGLQASDLVKRLGVIKGSIACLILSLFEREPEKEELVMDGIVIDKDYRGQGIGSMLLDKIIEYAVNNGFKSVRLDVIDTNPRAKKLYESKGFTVSNEEFFPYLKWLVGFSGSTTMCCFQFKFEKFLSDDLR